MINRNGIRMTCVALLSVCVCVWGGGSYVWAQSENIIEVTSSQEMVDGLVISGPHVVWKSVVNSALSHGVANPPLIHNKVMIVILYGPEEMLHNKYVCAVDAETGALRWLRNIPGVSEQVYIDGEVLYVGTDNGGVLALAVETGTDVWKDTPAEGDALVMSSFVADEMTLYFGYQEGILRALDKTTGTEKWQIKSGGLFYAAPIMDGERLYCAASNGGVYCIDAHTGSIIWQSMLKPDIYFLNILREGDSIVLFWCEYAPGERNDREMVTVSIFNMQTGVQTGSQVLMGRDAISWPICAFNKVFFSMGSKLYALDSATGEAAWQTDSEAVFFPSLAMQQETIFAGHAREYTATDAAAKYVYAFAATDGACAWQYSVPFGITEPLVFTEGLISSNSTERDEEQRMREYVFFVDAVTGQERGRVVIKQGESLKGQIITNGNEFYLTTVTPENNYNIYKMMLAE